MRVATVRDHQAALELIEEEFGLEWLERQVRQRECHPAAKQWKEMREGLEEYRRSGAFNINERILSLTRFAEDLRVARALGDYEVAISPRLRARGFTKVQYEIEVSALCLREGF